MSVTNFLGGGTERGEAFRVVLTEPCLAPEDCSRPQQRLLQGTGVHCSHRPCEPGKTGFLHVLWGEAEQAALAQQDSRRCHHRHT